MLSPQHAAILVNAFRHASLAGRNKLEAERARIHLQELELQLTHRREALETGASLVRDMLRALVEKRVDAVHSTFCLIQTSYADQQRHYMEQQDRVARRFNLKTTDPLERASCRQRLVEIDTQLGKIRRDFQEIYRELISALAAIKMEPPRPPDDNVGRLLLGLS